MHPDQAFLVLRTLLQYEGAAQRNPDLKKAASYATIAGNIKARAAVEGLDIAALRKAYDPARRDALLASMRRSGALTFEAQVAWTREHLDDVKDPQEFVGWLLHGQEQQDGLRKAHKLHSRLPWRGLCICLEQGKGETRDWYNPHDKTSGGQHMHFAYGYIREGEGDDGDKLDVYMGPHWREADTVYVVRQRKAPDFRQYDEEKCMVGFASATDAMTAYVRQYNDPRFMGETIYSMDADAFATYVKAARKCPASGMMQPIPVDARWLAAQVNPLAKLGVGDMLQQALKGLDPLAVPEPAPLGMADALRKAVQAARAARAHKYLRRVPTGDPKRPWRYYYSYMALGRGARQGEEVRLGDKTVKIHEVGPEGLTVDDGGQHKHMTVEQWHDLMHQHHGEAYVAAVDRRARGWASAVYKHLPRELLATATSLDEVKQRAPQVYEALAKSFARAGVEARDAQGMVAWLLARQGWTEDARATLLGAGCDLAHGVAVVKDYRAIGAAALAASGNKEVGAGHVMDVLADRRIAAVAAADKKDVGQMAARLQAREAAKVAKEPTQPAEPKPEPVVAPEPKPEPAAEPAAPQPEQKSQDDLEQEWRDAGLRVQAARSAVMALESELRIAKHKGQDTSDVEARLEAAKQAHAAASAVETEAFQRAFPKEPEAAPQPADLPIETEDDSDQEGDLASKAPRDPHTGAFDLGEHIPLSRKERWWLDNGPAIRAALLGADSMSLQEAEAEGVGKKIITKKVMLGDKPTPESLRALGLSSGAAYVQSYIHDALSPAPPDTPKARAIYTEIVRALHVCTMNAKTTEDLEKSLGDYWKRWEQMPHGDYRNEGTKESDEFMARFYSGYGRQQDVKNAMVEMDAVAGKRLTSLLMAAASVGDSKREAALKTARTVWGTADRKHDGRKRVVKPELIGTPDELRARQVYQYGKEYRAAGKVFSKVDDAHKAAEALREKDPRWHPDNARAPLPGESYTFNDKGMAVGPDGERLRPHLPPEHQDWSWAPADKQETDGATEGAPKPKAEPKRKIRMLDDDEEPPGREGPEPPTGSDAELVSHFGLRGVQHGNYMTEADRTHHARQAFVALHDLADILEMPVSSIAYNGRLGLAFGARGSGRALAHYEPSLHVINLTRDKGGGSLAHEWGHFFDHMLAQQSTSKSVKSQLASDLRPEGFEADDDKRLQVAFTSLVAAMHEGPSDTDSATRRKQLEYTARFGYGTRKASAKRDLSVFNHTQFKANSALAGAYWERPHEMFARAFEVYVGDKLASKGRSNNYLVAARKTKKANAVNEETGEHFSVYPQGDERKRINDAFDAFFDVARGHGILAKAFGVAPPEKSAADMLADVMGQ